MDVIKKPVLAIRCENKNKWERRVAITPEAANALEQLGAKIIIQPSPLRCFTEKQYDLGKKDILFQEDTSEANIFIGVKEVPIELLVPNTTYLFFSHTLKGQSHNMPLLKAVLDKKIRLIDYEPIKDLSDNPQRLVAFGRYAGLVGGKLILTE